LLRHRYGHILPDDDAGRADLYELLLGITRPEVSQPAHAQRDRDLGTLDAQGRSRAASRADRAHPAHAAQADRQGPGPAIGPNPGRAGTPAPWDHTGRRHAQGGDARASPPQTEPPP